MRDKTVIELIGSRIETIHNLQKRGGACHLPVIERNVEEIDRIVKTFMPSGSGFDAGTRLDYERSTPSKIVFKTSFHHMDEGMYCGWTEHAVTFHARFTSPDITVSGRDKRGIKDYIAETFHGHAMAILTQEWNEADREFTFTDSHGIAA